MSIPLPSANNDYAANDGLVLNREVWNAVFAAAVGGIGPRLRALEQIGTDLQVVIDAGTTQAIAVIATNIEPQIAAITAVIASLDAHIAESEDQIATIAAGGIDAAQVSESATRVFVTPAQKALIQSTADALGALMAGANPASDTFAEVAAALATKANVSALPTRGQIIGLSYGDGIGF